MSDKTASKSHESVNQNCPVSATIRLFGGKYKALLLWHLTGQTLRFNQLHRLVPEATPKMLTKQLRELEEDGNSSCAPSIRSYRRTSIYPLTPLGESLFPILEAMYKWGSALMKKEGFIPSCSMDSEKGEHTESSCHAIKEQPTSSFKN